MNPIGKQRIEGRLDACVPDSPGCPPYRYYLSIVCEYHKLLPYADDIRTSLYRIVAGTPLGILTCHNIYTSEHSAEVFYQQYGDTICTSL